ncbi:MAG: ABC transporter ATP-binding protein [Planctomycetota bacterium]
MNAIETRNVTCGYGAEPVLRGVSLAVRRGEFLGILGPNGSGKTTLVRAVTGVLELAGGRVLIDATDVGELRPREIARRVACVMQDSAIAPAIGNLAFTVQEIVGMGRTPYLSRTGWSTERDRRAVVEAMGLAEVADLADRPITELSGGERQRAFIAMALAQECDTVMLDEPTNHLDIAHQVGILDLFARLNAEGKTVVGIFHDLNLAAEYCERVMLLEGGRVAEIGAPADVLTADVIRDIYGADVRVDRNPATGRPHVFLGRTGPGT